MFVPYLFCLLLLVFCHLSLLFISVLMFVYCLVVLPGPFRGLRIFSLCYIRFVCIHHVLLYACSVLLLCCVSVSLSVFIFMLFVRPVDGLHCYLSLNVYLALSLFVSCV